jgi:phosphocarrier protein
MISKDLQVLNKLGLHARAAAKVVFIANKFVSDITLVKDNKEADARSIMKILMLSASKDSIINITIDGNDEIQAMNSIEKLFQNKFDEDL